ncbi:MAG: twin-arginine translocase subunit TatC [Lentisphaerae bacterium]|nr:twin-arginine translocase subunit TatC [Lentisphaerota bacterium]
MTEEKTMSLWEHLEELRWTLFKILGLVLVATGIGLFYVDNILEILIAPLNAMILKSSVKLNQAGPFDGVMIKMKVGILAGIVVSIPVIILQLWSFISPGLKKKERDSFWWIYSSISILFIAGVIAGYYSLSVLMPILVTFGVDGAENLWRLRDYVDFVFVWLLGAGIIFQLPLIIVILVKLGLVKFATLKKMRKYAVVVAFVISAIITPTPDAISQIIVAVPLYLLYEIGVFAASFHKRSGDLEIEEN